jgi:hypothetical protein
LGLWDYWWADIRKWKHWEKVDVYKGKKYIISISFELLKPLWSFTWKITLSFWKNFPFKIWYKEFRPLNISNWILFERSIFLHEKSKHQKFFYRTFTGIKLSCSNCKSENAFICEEKENTSCLKEQFWIELLLNNH